MIKIKNRFSSFYIYIDIYIYIYIYICFDYFNQSVKNSNFINSLSKLMNKFLRLDFGKPTT